MTRTHAWYVLHCITNELQHVMGMPSLPAAPQVEGLKARGVDNAEFRDKSTKLAEKEREFDRITQAVERMFAVLEEKRYRILSDGLSSFVAAQVTRSLPLQAGTPCAHRDEHVRACVRCRHTCIATHGTCRSSCCHKCLTPRCTSRCWAAPLPSSMHTCACQLYWPCC